MNIRRILSIATIIGLLLAASAMANNEYSEEFHAKYPISPNGRLIVNNITGNIRIAVWDRNEVGMDAVKRAYRQKRLSEAEIVISSMPDSIEIRTRYPDSTNTWTNDEEGRRDNPASVEYELHIPRGARAEKINLVNGSLHLEGRAGDVVASPVNGFLSAWQLEGRARLSTINGDLEVSFDHLNQSQIVDLTSVNGTIVLNLTSDVGARLNVKTGRGSIFDEFGVIRPDSQRNNRSFSATLRGGEGAINLAN